MGNEILQSIGKEYKGGVEFYFIKKFTFFYYYSQRIVPFLSM